MINGIIGFMGILGPIIFSLEHILRMPELLFNASFYYLLLASEQTVGTDTKEYHDVVRRPMSHIVMKNDNL